MVTVTLGMFHAVGFRETRCGHDRYIVKSCLTIYKPSLMQKLLQERLLVYSDKVRARPFDDATQEMERPGCIVRDYDAMWKILPQSLMKGHAPVPC